MTMTRSDVEGGDVLWHGGARDAARPSDPSAVSRGNGQAATPQFVIVYLGVDQSARRGRRAYAAYIPADEYAELIALLRGENP